MSENAVQSEAEITEAVLNRLINQAIERNEISIVSEQDLPQNGYKKVRFQLPEQSQLMSAMPSHSRCPASTSRNQAISRKIKTEHCRKSKPKKPTNKPTRQPRQPKQCPQLPGQTKLTDYYKFTTEATLE
jgi:hypothetical protein